MQRKFITNLIFLLFLNLLVKPFWLLGIDRSVQNAVGAESYGEYFALFNFSLLLNIILDVGITNFNNRNIAQSNHLLKKHFSRIFSLRIILGILYILVTLACGFMLGYSEMRLKILMLLGFNQFLAASILYFRSNISGLHLFKTDSIMSVLDRSLMIGICAVLLWGGVTGQSFKIEWFIYAQTAAYALTALVGFIVVAAKAGSFRIRWQREFSFMILRKSFPYALLILLMTFYYRLDTVMLDKMLDDGAVQAGIYAQAYRLFDASNMMAYLFSALLLPIFSRMLSKKENIKGLVKLAFSILFTCSMVLAAISIGFSDEIMNLLYNEHVGQSAPILGVLMACFIAVGMQYVFGTLLTANGSIRVLNIIALSGVGLNFFLNLILIPYYQAFGSAIASFATQFITVLIQVLVAWRLFGFRLQLKFSARLTLFIIGVGLLTYFIPALDYHWMVSLSILGVATLSWGAITGLLNLKGLYRLIFKGGEAI